MYPQELEELEYSLASRYDRFDGFDRGDVDEKKNLDPRRFEGEWEDIPF